MMERRIWFLWHVQVLRARRSFISPPLNSTPVLSRNVSHPCRTPPRVTLSCRHTWPNQGVTVSGHFTLFML